MNRSSTVTRLVCGAAAVICSTTLLFGPALSRAADAEASYADAVRATLEAGKRAPTGREASLMHPSGTVGVWFDLSSSGQVVAVGIDESSDSQLLDAQARALVNRSHQAPFPAHAFNDASTQRFTVRYAFGDPRGSVTVGPLRLASR